LLFLDDTTNTTKHLDDALYSTYFNGKNIILLRRMRRIIFLNSDVSTLHDSTDVDVNELLDEQNSKQSEKLSHNIDDEAMNYEQNVHTD
jgi:hypothetical protein